MRKLSDKQRVLRIWTKAFGWREFSTSDYTVESGTGYTLSSALYAKDAWANAAKMADAERKLL